jgi:ABC-type nitrate/sulfonate/bicarbonate transport system substrate-binding protein
MRVSFRTIAGVTVKYGRSALFLAGLVSVFAAAPASADEQLRLGWTSADAIYGPWFYGQDKGIFKKHNLDTNLIYFDSGTKGVQALIGGGVDILCADANAVMNAKFAGFQGFFVGTTLNVLTGSVYSAKSITKPEQLKGTSWGISSFGSEANVAANIALGAFKIDPKDVKLIQLGNQGNRVAALDAGQIQVTTFLPPISARIEAAGYPKLADLPDLAPNYFSVGPAVSETLFKDKRPVLKKFLKALAEATALYRNDRQGGTDVLQKYLKITDRKDAEIAYDYYAKLAPVNLRPTAESFKIHLENSKDPKAKTAKMSDFVNLSILDELDREGYFATLK